MTRPVLETDMSPDCNCVACVHVRQPDAAAGRPRRIWCARLPGRPYMGRWRIGCGAGPKIGWNADPAASEPGIKDEKDE